MILGDELHVILLNSDYLEASPPPHTLESKETEKSALECKENSQILKIPDHKNVNKNRLTPLKLYSKKHDKKVMDSRDGSGWGDKIDRPGRSHVPSSILSSLEHIGAELR